MSERREKVMQAAEKLVARGKLSQAIREYRKLLQENPNDTNTLNRVGDLYARQDKVDEAVGLFEQIAASYGRDGFFVKAIAIYKKIIRLDPTQFEVYERLAELYHRQGLLSEARSQYQVLAEYHVKKNDMAGAIEIHRKIADLDPTDPTPRVKLAELYHEQDLIEETIGEYQRIAEVLLEHGRVEEATKVYLRALAIDSGDLAFISEAVISLREEGFAAAADEVFQTAVRLNPDAAELADRMRRHEAEKSAPVPRPEPEASVEVEADEDTAVDVAELIDLSEEPAAPARRTAGRAKEAELEGLDVTEDGAFVIDLEEDASALEAAPTDLEPEKETVVGEEMEIDLAELEEAAEKKTEDRAPRAATEKPVAEPADPVASIDALAESLGVGRRPSAERSDEAAPVVTPTPTAGEPDGGRVELAELLAEADVFAKYGLESKAVRRLEQAVQLESSHLEAHRRLVLLALRRGDDDRVLSLAQRMLDQVEEVGAGGAWEEVLGALVSGGFQIEDGRIEKSAVEPAAAPAKETPPEPVDEGLEWLETATPDEAEVETKALFEAEEKFFDLAAELEQEIVAGAEAPEDEIAGSTRAGEESLEEIVQGFKKGVAEVLSPEAYDTHYNLGIAYREMGLIDEAIGEFQLSAKDPAHLVDSCSMLGASFLEKGFPDLAVKWYKRGLETPELSEEESLSLLYDLGSVYAASGDREAAYETFVEIYGINSHYRDVVARLEELRG